VNCNTFRASVGDDNGARFGDIHQLLSSGDKVDCAAFVAIPGEGCTEGLSRSRIRIPN
jgi:hypothetical protein